MSVQVSRLVWDHYHGDATRKLVLLRLADHADHRGGSIHPSIKAVALACCLSVVQARRHLHALISEGVVAVIGNLNGGKPGTTRRYQIDLALLTALTHASPTPLTDESPTPLADESRTPLAHESDGSRPCEGTALAHESQTIKEPSRTTSKSKGKHPLPPNFGIDPEVAAWARAEGHDRLDEHLEAFIDKALAHGYEYADWNRAFKNAIRGDWAGLRSTSGNKAVDPIEEAIRRAQAKGTH